MRIRPLATAIGKRYLQVNTPAHIRHMIFDVDRPAGAWAWEVEGLPPPAWTVTGESGHGHIVYTLAAPVCKTEAARVAPRRYLAAIHNAFTARLGADVNYGGLITRNPFAPGAHAWHGPQSASDGYSLDFLAEFVTAKGAAPAPAPLAYIGRNVSLFDATRKHAYKIASSFQRLDDLRFALTIYATQQNVQMFAARALSESEVRGIVKSVAKWVHKRYDAAASNKRFSSLQAARGKASGVARLEKRAEARAEARQRQKAGETQAQIALALGVTQSTVSRWLR